MKQSIEPVQKVKAKGTSNEWRSKQECVTTRSSIINRDNQEPSGAITNKGKQQ